MKRVWIHNKKAGLINEEGKEGYVCRGFKKEDGPLLAAAPDMLEVLKTILPQMNTYPDGYFCIAEIEAVEDAIAKAEGIKKGPL